MSNYHLAQLNIATLLAPIDSPQLKGFVDNLERINQLAESSPGYIWRLQSDEGDATAFRPFGDEILVNLSVWRSLEALKDFVYESAHIDFMRRRQEWFERMKEAYTVLWWVPEAHQPSLQEAKERLDQLRSEGASQNAFTFGKPFPAPD